MALQDFLLRAKNQASVVAFNNLLPTNFKLLSGKIRLPGVNLYIATSGGLAPVDNGGIIHLNLRVTPAYSGWEGLFITDPSDPDYDDPKLDKSKLKRWAKNNGGEEADDASLHPRTGRADFNWWRIPLGNGKYMDISIAKPALQRLTFS